MHNPYVKIISHPYWSLFEVDMEKLTKAAVQNNILLELNASFFFRKGRLDEKTLEKMKTMIEILKQNNKKIIINSDAHSPYEVGRFEEVMAKFSELGLNDNDILNNDVEAVLKHFNLS
jgi:putative hydrolase